MYRFLEQTTDGYMTRNVKTVARDLNMLELSEMFERDDFNSYPVEEDGQIVGIVTKFDILRCFAFTPSQMVPRYLDLMNRKVGDVMTPEFIYVHPDTRLTRVLQLMVEHRIRSIIVLDASQRLVGIVAREDVITALKATARD
ncbi:CBS domain-containing protein [Bradyrhizobium manausense]|uniref:CBS domain-containing protein n=1 Tax=Bradyrhizobium TaxID=374 RepID=UPI001BAB0E17|nr:MULTISPECIES: CBS domain-containing protein [Bradyrhizobium]MBR0824467.1 CBS domain-containing protein [Bradyrhizobium manausense]UVO26856.1 CBS domain-containing protein [Bradyrhizobium arachidis]